LLDSATGTHFELTDSIFKHRGFELGRKASNATLRKYQSLGEHILRQSSCTSSRTTNAESSHSKPDIRYARNVQSLYLKPLRREATHGIPSCDLQLRSYSVANLELFTDFALRAAYYLGLPAFGPVPLPRITERWTVTKSTFIFKKAQENFERITIRRLIQIRDGHPGTVQLWLAFLNKHAYYGIGMKANLWEFSTLGTSICVVYLSGA
jgi:ribosomal protein S10